MIQRKTRGKQQERWLGFNSTLRRAENTTKECGYSHKQGWHLMLPHEINFMVSSITIYNM